MNGHLFVNSRQLEWSVEKPPPPIKPGAIYTVRRQHKGPSDAVHSRPTFGEVEEEHVDLAGDDG